MLNNIENIMKVIKYIEAHLTEKIDLDTVADAVHYSKYHLHRMFTNTVGLTIHDYVQRRQLTKAAKLLVFSEKPILEIALLAGYESQQAFTSIFKAMYKQSPNQYRESEEFYPLQLRYILRDNPTKINDSTINLQRDVAFAVEEDIPLWMDLVCLVVDGFPYLKQDEYILLLKQSIIEKRALIMKDNTIAIGVIAFSYDTGSIDFLGVHPQYRKQGIARAFLNKVMDEILKDGKISVTTYREGDKADTGYRETYKSLGFTESELLVEFGYPTQKFVLQRKSKEGINDE